MRHTERLIEIVCRQQYEGLEFPRALRHQRGQTCRERRVEGDERLIQHKQRRLDRERPGQRYTPGHSERELARKAMLAACQSDLVQQRG